jgi:pimeloyl-ACP methyl ester carboxylesterase
MTPYVLVHGSPGSPRAWGPVRRAFPEGTVVVTPTLPGHGPEEGLLDPALGIEERADVVIDAMRTAATRADGGKVVLVGYSFGGVNAVCAALRAPELVDRLVLLEPVLVPLLDGSSDPDAATLRPRFEGYAAAVEAGDPDAIAIMVGIWFGPDAYAGLPTGVKDHFRSRAEANARDVRATMRYRQDDRALAALDVPVTVVLGSTSPSATATLCRTLVARLPRAELIELGGAGHAMIDSHSAEVAAILTAEPR